jgi:hypothetical protein
MMVTDLIGHPYTKEHDCNWLHCTVAQRAGKAVDLPETPDSKEDWPEFYRDVIAKHYRKVESPKEGDLAVFEVPDKNHKMQWHCGTITRPGWMITTRQTVGVHLARLNAALWRVCFKGYYTYDPH